MKKNKIYDYFVKSKYKKIFSPHFDFIVYDKKEKAYIKQCNEFDYFGNCDVWEEFTDRKNATVFTTRYPLDCIRCDTINSLGYAKDMLESYEDFENLKFVPVFSMWRKIYL